MKPTYIIATDLTTEGLQQHVVEWMAQGYRCVGGIAVEVLPGYEHPNAGWQWSEVKYHQAMVLEAPKVAQVEA